MAHAPPRQLAIEGSRNLRDLGGYPAADGRPVAWGRLYRSGHFGDVTTEGQRQVAALGLAAVIDLRTADERAKNPNRFADDTKPQLHEVPIDPGSSEGFRRRIAEQGGTDGGMAGVMEQMNRSLVRDHAAPFCSMFELLVAGPEGPRVFHCASGKDRTGIGAALVLSALGVEQEAVVADFLLTNGALDLEREVRRAIEEFGGSAGPLDLPTEKLRPMLEVRASYLLAAYDEIDRNFGGIEAYLTEQMGLDRAAREQLHARYLEPRA